MQIIKVILILTLMILSSTALSLEYFLVPKAYLDIETGVWVYNKKIHIKNNLIIDIVDSNLKSKIKEIRYPQTFLIPGLIDSHTHIFFTQTITDKNFENALVREGRLTSEFRTNRAKVFLHDYLNEGFTTIVDLGNSGEFLDVKLRNQIQSDFRFPMLLVSGPGITNQSGQFYKNTPLSEVVKEYEIVDLKTNVHQLLKKYSEMNVDILKLYLDNDPSEGGLSIYEINNILNDPLIKNFKKITAHAIIKASMDKINATGIKSIEHASTINFLEQKNKLDVTVTDLNRELLKEFDYYSDPIYKFKLNRIKQLKIAGHNLVFGPDLYFTGNFNRGVKVKDTISFFTEAGLSNLEVLKMMTINSAKALKMENKIGRIYPGNLANFVGLKESPILNINALKKISLVINQGQILTK